MSTPDLIARYVCEQKESLRHQEIPKAYRNAIRRRSWQDSPLIGLIIAGLVVLLLWWK